MKQYETRIKTEQEKNPAIKYTISADGLIKFKLNNKLHCETGPAIESLAGDKEWQINGKRHRKDGPALEWANGDKEWWIDGKLHRTDGPAIESKKIQSYYLNGIPLTQEKWEKLKGKFID